MLETQWGWVDVGVMSNYGGYVPHTNPKIEEMVLIDYYDDGGPVDYEVCYRTYDSRGPSLIWDDGQYKICGTHWDSGNDFGEILIDQTVALLIDWIHDTIG